MHCNRDIVCADRAEFQRIPLRNVDQKVSHPMLVCCPLPTSQSFRHCTLVNTRIQLSRFSLEIKKKTMSCSMTITRTTVATSGTSVYVNTGYLQTLPGLLKLAQFLLGIACVALVAYYMDHGYSTQSYKPELFFLLISVTFLIGTFCLLLSCLISLATATVISKTIYEVIYHGIAFILYLCAGLTLLIEVNHQTRYRRDFEPFLAASIMGLVMAGLYLLSTFLANRRYRGI